MGVKLRVLRASQDHAATIAHMTHRTWHACFPSFMSKDQIDYGLRRIHSVPQIKKRWRAGADYFLSKSGVYIHGFMAISYPGIDAGSKVARIDGAYVFPEEQRCGVGSEMLRTVAALVDAAGYERLTLHIHQDNPFISFFYKAGFEKVGEEAVIWGKKFKFVEDVLDKRLGNRQTLVI